MNTSKFQFLTPYLEELVFKTNENFDLTDDNVEIQNSFSIQVKKDKTENIANVKLILDLNTENDDVPFSIHIIVASNFIWENLNEKEIDSMLNINAPALLLSYMRPIIANITNSSKFPVYNLPFINFKE